jgi:hypothetical protein
VTLNTTGTIGTNANRIQFADNTTNTQQNVVIGSTNQASNVSLDGLGDLTLGAITGNTANTVVDVTARAALNVKGAMTTGTGTIVLKADHTAAGAADDNTGTLSVLAGGSVASANTTTSAITLRGADMELDTSGGAVVTATGAGGGVVIGGSTASRAMSLGGTNTAVTGVNLTDAELTKITTAASGTITFGDTSQTGDITFTTATPATTAGAAIVALQSTGGGGKIVLDDAGAGTALAGGSSTIALTAGTAGITATNTNNAFAEIATTGATVTLNTTGTIGTNANRIQFADNTNTAQQRILIGGVNKPATGGVFLGGLGALTLDQIDTNGAAVSVGAANALSVIGAITTTPTAAAAGGAVTLEATTGGITTVSNGTITTTGSGANAGGEVYVHSIGAGTITLGKSVTAKGGAGGNGGNVTVLNEAGAVAVNSVIDVGRGVGGAADGTIALKASGNITEGAAGGFVGDSNGKLLVHSTGGSITLGTAGNNAMATVALKTDTAVGVNGAITYKESNSLAIGSIAGVGSLTSPSGGAAASTVGSVTGINTVAGNVEIQTGGAVSQSGASTIGGNLWVVTTSGNIGLTSLNTLGGKVSLIASGTGAEVSLYASKIDVNTVEAPSGAGGVKGILGTTVILRADSGSAFQVATGDTGGLVKATSTSTSTPVLTIKANNPIGSTADLALRVETSGLVVVEGTGVSDGTINLKGDDKIQPKYEFSGNPLYRKVLYNGNEATNAQLTGALDAAYLDIRNATTEVRESGFAKENASKVLRRGVVTSAGPGQPAVDDSTGMAGAEECEGGFADGSLSCQ